MAQELITTGIGAPGGITSLILFGLSPGGADPQASLFISADMTAATMATGSISRAIVEDAALSGARLTDVEIIN